MATPTKALPPEDYAKYYNRLQKIVEAVDSKGFGSRSQIAVKAGIPLSTVSAILNGRLISPNELASIETAIAELAEPPVFPAGPSSRSRSKE